MNLVLGIILLAAAILIAMWVSQNWALLLGQWRALWLRPPPGEVVPPEGHAPPPADAASHGAPATPAGPGGKRHTVLPHQARGR